MTRFFSYDDDLRFEEHDTADAASKCAEGRLDYDRDNAHEGWPEEVTDTCWGVVLARVTETSRAPVTCPYCEHRVGDVHAADCDDFEPGRRVTADFDEHADYELLPVPGAIEAVLAMATDAQLHAELARREAAERSTEDGDLTLIQRGGR